MQILPLLSSCDIVFSSVNRLIKKKEKEMSLVSLDFHFGDTRINLVINITVFFV